MYRAVVFLIDSQVNGPTVRFNQRVDANLDINRKPIVGPWLWLVRAQARAIWKHFDPEKVGYVIVNEEGMVEIEAPKSFIPRVQLVFDPYRA